MTPADFKKARRKLGLSAQGMADLVGVKEGRTIRRYEAGEIAISGTVEKLIGYLLRDPAVPKAAPD